MRRMILAAGVIACSLAGAVNGSAVEMTVKGEYRHDAFEYGEPAKDFYRAVASLSYTATVSCGAAYLQDAAGTLRRYTWYLLMSTPKGNARLIMGNFYPHFGSGLVVGKKRIYSPDPFAARPLAAGDTVFSPCKNGDQRYSFHGAAMTVSGSIAGMPVTMAPFYSLRYRYLHDDCADTRTVESSLATILGKTTVEPSYGTPVLVCDGGGLVQLGAGRRGLLQCYGMHTEIMRPGGGHVLWDKETARWPPGADRAHCSYGMYLFLHCGPLSLQAEGGYTVRDRRLETGSHRSLRGKAFQGGLSFHRKNFSFFIRGRTADKGFSVPYSLTDSFPGSTGEGGLSLDFHRLALGGTVTAEKRLLALPGEDSTRMTNRQRLWIKARFPLGRIDLALRRMERRADRRAISWQGKIRCRFEGEGPLGGDFSFIWQKHGEGPSSWALWCGAHWSWRRTVMLSAGYGYCLAAAENPLYVNMGGMFRSPASGSFMKDPSHYFGGGMSLSMGGCQGRVQYYHWMDRWKTSSWKVEASLIWRF